jgi:hypothetical protein
MMMMMMMMMMTLMWLCDSTEKAGKIQLKLGRNSPPVCAVLVQFCLKWLPRRSQIYDSQILPLGGFISPQFQGSSTILHVKTNQTANHKIRAHWALKVKWSSVFSIKGQ